MLHTVRRDRFFSVFASVVMSYLHSTRCNSSSHLSYSSSRPPPARPRAASRSNRGRDRGRSRPRSRRVVPGTVLRAPSCVKVLHLHRAGSRPVLPVCLVLQPVGMLVFLMCRNCSQQLVVGVGFGPSETKATMTLELSAVTHVDTSFDPI